MPIYLDYQVIVCVSVDSYNSVKQTRDRSAGVCDRDCDNSICKGHQELEVVTPLFFIFVTALTW